MLVSFNEHTCVGDQEWFITRATMAIVLGQKEAHKRLISLGSFSPLAWAALAPCPSLRLCTRIYIVYHRYIIIKKGKEQTHEVWTRHISNILVRTAYYWNMPCIYHVYTMHIPVRFWYTRFIPRILVVYTIYIYNVYLRDIHCIYNVYPCIS